MHSPIASTALAVLATSSLVAAQTSTDCDPTKEPLGTCPTMKAFGSKAYTVDFTKGASDLFNESQGSTAVTYDNSLGAIFSIAKDTDAPTFASDKWLFFGKVDVTVRASVGTGIVTSFVLQSQDLDEIDWEWLGSDTTQVQTNYFSKGDTSTYDRGGFTTVASPQEQFHTYTIDWNADRLLWIIDGATVRTLTYADAKNGATYPQTPMQVKLGTWCGGCSKDEGTVQWAGGKTDFSQAPFNGYYKSMTIQDYSNGVANAVSYEYKDQTGTYQGIKVNTGDSTESGSNNGASESVSPTNASSSGTQGAPSTLTNSSGITQPTGSSSSSFSGSNGTTTGGTAGTSTGATGSSQTSPIVTSGAGSLAISLASVGTALFALLSL